MELHCHLVGKLHNTKLPVPKANPYGRFLTHICDKKGHSCISNAKRNWAQCHPHKNQTSLWGSFAYLKQNWDKYMNKTTQ